MNTQWWPTRCRDKSSIGLRVSEQSLRMIIAHQEEEITSLKKSQRLLIFVAASLALFIYFDLS